MTGVPSASTVTTSPACKSTVGAVFPGKFVVVPSFQSLTNVAKSSPLYMIISP